jgi:hypothetical protein
MRISVWKMIVIAASAAMAAGGCSAIPQLAAPTTSPVSQAECGRTPGTAGTWRPELGYCEF